MLYFTTKPTPDAPQYVWVEREGPSNVRFRGPEGKTVVLPKPVFYAVYQLVTAEHIQDLAWQVQEKLRAMAEPVAKKRSSLQTARSSPGRW